MRTAQGMMGAVFAIMFGPYVIKAQEAITVHLGIGLFGTIYGAATLIAAVLWKAFSITHPVFAVILCIVVVGPTFVAGPRILSTIGTQQIPLMVYQLPLWCRIFFIGWSPTAILEACNGGLRHRALEQATELRCEWFNEQFVMPSLLVNHGRRSVCLFVYLFSVIAASACMCCALVQVAPVHM